MNSPVPLPDLSTALEMAVIRSWKSFQQTRSSALMRVEYHSDAAGALTTLKLWSAGLARGEWDLFSEYSVCHTAFHPAALTFVAGREITAFSTALDGILQNPSAFRTPFRTTAPQLVVVRAPSAAEYTEASAARWTELKGRPTTEIAPKDEE